MIFFVSIGWIQVVLLNIHGITVLKMKISSNEICCLSGFLSALMSFSQEMFGDDISSTNIKEKLMTFERLPNRDIMVLVTTLEFEPFYCRQILSKLNEYISNLELPEMTGKQSQFKFIEPFLLDAIEGSIPLSIEETILPILENRLQDLKSQGYLILKF